MRKVIVGIGLMCFAAATVFAALSKDEVKRLSESATILREFRQAPDKGIPEDLWSRAECVIVIPSLKKAAFIVGGEYGSGVMSCHRDHVWSAPVFMQLAKGSWGLQLGAEQIDLVLLMMNRSGVDKLLDDKVSLGADASVAAGPVGRTANAATDAKLSAEMLAYSRSQGLFAGIECRVACCGRTRRPTRGPTDATCRLARSSRERSGRLLQPRPKRFSIL